MRRTWAFIAHLVQSSNDQVVLLGLRAAFENREARLYSAEGIETRIQSKAQRPNTGLSESLRRICPFVGFTQPKQETFGQYDSLVRDANTDAPNNTGRNSAMPLHRLVGADRSLDNHRYRKVDGIHRQWEPGHRLDPARSRRLPIFTRFSNAQRHLWLGITTAHTETVGIDPKSTKLTNTAASSRVNIAASLHAKSKRLTRHTAHVRTTPTVVAWIL